jgi:hypothetical protein
MICNCSGKHVPKPMKLVEIDINGETLWLCPTTFTNLQEYLTRWRQDDRVPSGSFRKHYSAYVQELAGKVMENVQ